MIVFFVATFIWSAFGFGESLFAVPLLGAYGLNGFPLVIYGSLRRWSPQHFCATFQGYFLPAGSAGMIGFYFDRLWTSEVN